MSLLYWYQAVRTHQIQNPIHPPLAVNNEVTPADELLARGKAKQEEGDDKAARRTFRSVIRNHPDSAEAAEAQLLIDQIDEKAAKEKEEAEAAVLREIEEAEAAALKEQEEAEAAAKQKEEERAVKIKQTLSAFRKKVDEIKEIEWYYDHATSEYINTNDIHLYIGVPKHGDPFLRLRIRYTADNWLFIEKYIIKADDSKYTMLPGYFNVQRDNSGGEIWEWYDTSPTSNEIEMIRSIIESEQTTLRHEGSQYYNDRTITNSEKRALKNVLDAYELITATNP